MPFIPFSGNLLWPGNFQPGPHALQAGLVFLEIDLKKYCNFAGLYRKNGPGKDHSQPKLKKEIT